METQEELQALYAIFSHMHNVQLLPENFAVKIREHLEGGRCSDHIANGIQYHQYFRNVG